MPEINLGLDNTRLYAGCRITEVAGRKNLVTEPHEAIGIVGRNVEAMLEEIPRADRYEIVLTGPMAVWAYLVVFHACVHRFARVVYDDGKSMREVIAAHG